MTTPTKKMREKVIDIMAGAGLWWMEEGYFEAQDDYSSCILRAIRGFIFTFDLPHKTRLTNINFLDQMENPDDIVDLIKESLKYDKENS